MAFSRIRRDAIDGDWRVCRVRSMLGWAVSALMVCANAACGGMLESAQSDAEQQGDGATRWDDARLTDSGVDVAIDATDSEADRRSDSSASETCVPTASPRVAHGCPDAPPTDGQSCEPGPGHYYCFYYLPGQACPRPWKCTSFGTEAPPYSFHFGTPDCTQPPPEACNEGLACGNVEVSGACIVRGACGRRCSCDATSRKLTCASLEAPSAS